MTTPSRIIYMMDWNAWTRLQRSRTRVWLDGTWRRGRDTADCESVSRRATSCHVDSPTLADAAQIEPYRPNIGVFRPEKGNRPVRRKKKLKPKIPVDLIRRLHRLNPFLLLLLLFCFFVFFFFFFHSVSVLFCSVAVSVLFFLYFFVLFLMTVLGDKKALFFLFGSHASLTKHVRATSTPFFSFFFFNRKLHLF